MSRWEMQVGEGGRAVDLRLPKRRFTDDEVAEQARKLPAAFDALGLTQPLLSIKVDCAELGFGDRGMAALCEALVAIRRPRMQARLLFYKLRLTDDSMPHIAKVLQHYEGMVLELHLSHNDITNEGAKRLLVKDVIQHYPIPTRGMFKPLWLRLEQCKVNSRLGLPAWMYTPDKQRMKPQQDCPALQVPHLDLPVPPANAYRQRPTDTIRPQLRHHPTHSPPPQAHNRGAPGGGGQGAKHGPSAAVASPASTGKSEVMSHPPGSDEWAKQQQRQELQNQHLGAERRRRQQQPPPPPPQQQQQQLPPAQEQRQALHDSNSMQREGMGSLSHIAGDTARFEAERQAARQNLQLQAQQRQQAQQQQLQQQQQQQQQQLTPPRHGQGVGQGGFHGGFGGFGGGTFGAGPMFAGLRSPFDSMQPLPLPPQAAFGANSSLPSSHANPRVPPGLDGQLGSLVVPSGLGQAVPGPQGAGPGGSMRGGGMPCVGNAFTGFPLDASNDRTSGNDSPDTSTEFEFAMGSMGALALGAGVPQRRGGGSAHLAGPGPSAASASPPSSAPAVQGNVEMLKEMFPDIGHESIRQILHNCNGDIAEAANELSDRPQARPSSNWSYAPSPQKVAAPARQRNDNLYLDWSIGEVSYYLVIGYLGTGWAGFQFNDNIDTGQGALLGVLKDMDAVRSHKPDASHTFTASRTDKGVHAVCLLLQQPMRQIKYGAEGEFVKRVNAELQRRGAPHKNMHLFSVMMTPKEYLDPRDHLNIREWSCRINSNHLIYSRTYYYVIPSYLLSKLQGDVSKDTILANMKRFKLLPQQLEHANSMFAAYVRRADFRAFTDPKRLSEYETQDAGGTEREVIRCGVNRTLNSGGFEFALIEITGDRFMYHQIRLMMGLAFLSIQVDYTPQESIGAVLSGNKVPGKNFEKIPLAPAEPLLLRELNYKDDGLHNNIASLLSNTKDQRDWFCNEKVLPHVWKEAPKPAADFVNELHQTGGCAWKIKNKKR